MKKIIYHGYQVVAGGFFGLVFGIAILLITAAFVHNLLMLTLTGQKIEKAVLPFMGYLAILVPVSGLILGVIIGGRKKKQQTGNEK